MKVWTVRGTPDEAQLGEIAGVLSRGGVLLMPTDTIYGLHARALDLAAVERVAALKGRDERKPFIVLAASIAQLQALPLAARQPHLDALAALWPAPLTAVLPLTEPVPATRGAASVGVRVPALPWLRALLERTGLLVSTSANRSGEPAVHSPADLARELQGQLDGIVDAGRQEAFASTVVDLTGDEPRLLREGARSFTQIVRKTLWK